LSMSLEKMMRKLTGIAFSPWSEKAKWALDHHHLDYQYEEYVPFLGEFLLRMKMRMPSGVLTVPVMRVDGSWLTDSLDIARYADRNGAQKTLFPDGKQREIELWNTRGEQATSAGRALAVVEAARHPKTAAAFLPPPLRPILGGVAQKGLEAFINKYRMREDFEKHESAFVDGLHKLEAALARGSGYVVGDDFTYADIAMAMVVQFVVPVDNRYMPAGPPGVEPKPNQALATRFAGLVAWRDALYAKHRRT
jgi:glutathione S-transferase